MRFSDTETQALLRSNARTYLADQFPFERLLAIEGGQQSLGANEVKALADLGWLGLTAPEASGGSGGSLLDAAVLADEFGYAAVPAPVTVSNVAAALLAGAGEPARDVLRGLASGAHIVTVSEESRRRGHFGPAGERRPTGVVADGGTLRGELPLVPHADLATHVLAPLTVDGQSAFAVLSLEGARVERRVLLDRRNFFDVTFTGQPLARATVVARGTEAERLHERCDALATAFELMEIVGAMLRVQEMSAAYISNRVQFGQPIAKFQAARHRAAELMMSAKSSRWAAYHAVWQLARPDGDVAEVWLAKHWAVRAADRVYTIAHLLHGGIGVGMDYPLHLFTLFLAGAVVRAGAMNELNARILDEMRVKASA